jgi:hypothetical protein
VEGNVSHDEHPDLGSLATVFMDRHDHGPVVWEPGDDFREIEGDAADGELVSDLNIVSIYTLHVALYALQNPTAENIERALYKIGTSGDCEEWTDGETLLPLPVPPPDGWERTP